MKRRSFLAGLLGTTAVVALPLPKVPPAVAAPLPEVGRRLIFASNFNQIIGIALNSADPGEVVRLLLNSTGSIMEARATETIHAGGALAYDDTPDPDREAIERILLARDE